MTPGERLFPLRIRTLPRAESFGGVRASVAAERGTLADALASVAEARARVEARDLEAIAADLGDLMAETAFNGLDQLRADFDAHCKRWGLCGR